MLLALDRHGEHPVSLGGLEGMIFFPFERCIWPIRSLRFLFLLKATTGLFLKVGARSLWVFSRSQCLLIIFLVGGRSRLNVVVKGVLCSSFPVLSRRRASRGTVSVFAICLSVSVSGYPLLLSLVAISFIARSASSGLEQIFFARKNCPNGMFLICSVGW